MHLYYSERHFKRNGILTTWLDADGKEIKSTFGSMFPLETFPHKDTVFVGIGVKPVNQVSSYDTNKMEEVVSGKAAKKTNT